MAKQAQVNAAQQNQVMRAMLMQSSPLMLKNLGSTTGAAGQTSRIKLYNVGLITRLILRVDIGVTIGTAIATPSPANAFKALTRIKLTDFDGTDRINAAGFQLAQQMSLRNEMIGWAGYANVQANVNNAAGAAGLSSNFVNPVVPTAVASDTLSFYLDIPLAFDVRRGDLRGMILAQTTVGELYLNVDVASALYTNGSDDYVYNGAATTTVAITSVTFTVWQEYFLPQESHGVVPYPQLDVLTVYELNGNLRSSDNLAANTEKLMSFPNVRQIIGVYASYYRNSILAGGSTANTYTNDMQTLRIIANGNNILQERSVQTQYYEQRRILGTDAPRGVYLWDFRANPIQTALYGNMQAGFTPATAPTGTTFLELLYESFYIKGAVLGGMSQGN